MNPLASDDNTENDTRKVVPRHSAVIQGQRNVEEIPLNADHKSMTKFESLEDGNFQRMARILKRMVNKATEGHARQQDVADSQRGV